MRQLESLMRGLPLDGALARSLDPERAGIGWTRTHDFLALIAELVDGNTRLHFSVNTKKGTPLPEPLQIPRPGTTPKQRSSSPQALSSLLVGELGMRIIKE